MKRLTVNKDVSEMSMMELAHNSCYAKDKKARYRDYNVDVDARELAIKLLDKFADIPNEFTCDEDFDDFILDSLQDGTDSITGLIAMFYRNIWAMAELRERLKEYEDLKENGKLLKLLWIDLMHRERMQNTNATKLSCSLNDSTELKKLILENPELPLLVLCGEDAWSGEYPYEQADVRGVGVGEMTFYKDYWLDRDDYRDSLSGDLYDKEEYAELSDEEYEKMIDQKVEETEFVKAIVIYVG